MKRPALPWQRSAWPAAAQAPAQATLALAGLAAAFFGLRVLLLQALAAQGVSLHVDEAQYWDWWREPAWGYYSKPPVVAALTGLSAQWFGATETGARLLALACWTLAGVVLAGLARAMAAAAPTGSAMQRDAGRYALWTLLVWASSPLAGLLGLVSTSDAPLVLTWALALRLLWALRAGASAGLWAGLGAVIAVGLLSKYSFAALLPGALVWLLWQGGRRQLGGMVLAGAVALALLTPHLGWNVDAGWPTWRHTAEITVQSVHGPGQAAAALGSLLAFSAAQPLMLAPVLLPVLGWAARRRQRAGQRLQGMPPAAVALLVATTAPLLLAGLAQALRGRAEVNWIAPAHLAASLALAWLAVQTLAARRGGWRWPAAQAALVALLALAPVIWLALRPASPVPVALDPWARLRGWGPALRAFEPWLDATPGALVLGSNRTVLAHGAWHWRHRAAAGGSGLPARLAWAPAPAHHYAWRCPWPALAGPAEPGRAPSQPVFLLSEGEPDAALLQALGGIEVLHRARVQRLDRDGPELVWARVTATLQLPDRVCR